jgi:hypothetical protein
LEQPALYLFEPEAVPASGRTALASVGKQVMQLIPHHIDPRSRLDVTLAVRTHIAHPPGNHSRVVQRLQYAVSGEAARVVFVPSGFRRRTTGRW